MSEGTGNYQLPPGKSHTWIVIVRGVVQVETIDRCPSAYRARERAVMKYGEGRHVVALLPDELKIVRKRRAVKR